MELNFKIDKLPNGRAEMIIKIDHPLEDLESIIEWNDRMNLINSEISKLPYVSRKSYGRWVWFNEHELKRWLTYYHLRFTEQNDQS